MCSAGSIPVLPGWVAPFGNPRLSLIDSKPRLIAVFPRPSSALNAKASTVRPFRLTYTNRWAELTFSCDYIQFLRCYTQQEAARCKPPHQFTPASMLRQLFSCPPTIVTADIIPQLIPPCQHPAYPEIRCLLHVQSTTAGARHGEVILTKRVTPAGSGNGETSAPGRLLPVHAASACT